MKIVLFLFVVSIFVSCDSVKKKHKADLRSHLENILNEHTLKPWYPRVIDTNNGGYYTNFSFNWTKEQHQDKFIVTQARHVWTLSKAFEFYPERKDYKKHAQHGYEFLKNFMWDNTYGGFYQLVDSTGLVPEGPYTFEKRSYGNAFAIYALAAFYKISSQKEVLDMAINAFQWFDKMAHDKEYGGYFQYLYRDGSPIPRSVLNDGYDAPDKAHVGLKDYNSSIHILEAFTELYQVWPDELLRDRLSEMYRVVSETMYDRRGFLKLHFYPDWTLVADEELTKMVGERSSYTNHVTFGHDVETAFLLLEAAAALDIEEQSILPKARQFVDHALLNGWDREKGGFYEQGKYIDGKMKILDEGKNWWAQVEGMNALLLMHTYYPDQSYYENFQLIVQYIDENLLDHQHMGWYSGGIDHHPELKKGAKAQMWKGNYHTARSLMHCITMLDQANSH